MLFRSQVNKLLASEVASSRSTFGQGAKIYRSAEAIETLGTQIPDPNNLDSRQIAEIATNLDAMLRGGSATIGGTNKLIPSTYTGSLAKIEEYLLKIPIGSQQGAFVKRMLETVKREKELAKEQIKRTQKKLLGSYSNLADDEAGGDSVRWSHLMRVHGLPADIQMDDSEPKELSKSIGESTPKKQSSNSSGLIKIRRKSDGAIKLATPEEASRALSDSNFERVE